MRVFKPVLAIAILIIVFGGVYYVIAGYKEKNQILEKSLLENKELTEKIKAENSSEVLRLNDEVARLQQQIQDLSESTKNEGQLDHLTASILQQLNYEGTEKDIIAELILHPELIPYDGILGGTMQLSAEGAKVLSHEWIFAPFSDGHTLGHLLVEYKVNDGKLTDWKTIDTYILGDELK
ncbi:hypothetical protein [Sporosarcina sp. NPDC096371]|uniref:hypothetical protein n=1 Tax=Sporosarcina sp. NPDC096371 TaxID=3364530 RepID=UPI0037F1EB1E